MNAIIDPVHASLAAELSAAMNVPNESAQSQLAAMKIEARRRLDDAEMTIADLHGRRIAAQERAKAEKAAKLDRHSEDESAELARDSAAIERLRDALALAEQTFAASAKAYKDGRHAIERDCDGDLSLTLRAIAEEESAAKLVKAMAEAALGAGATEVRS